MRYFIDCEFIEDGRTIDLISIGIVAEDGREYYAINKNCNFKKACQWVKENVLINLPPRNPIHPMNGGGSPRQWEESKAWKSKEVIAIEVMAFLKNQPIVDLHHFERGWLEKISARWFGTDGMKDHPLPKIQDIFHDAHGGSPEIWGEWCSYDWVALCQLFGTMMDLPKGFPMRCRDVIQYAEDHLGVSSDRLPASLETDGNHNALLGAKTVRERYLWLKSLEAR